MDEFFSQLDKTVFFPTSSAQLIGEEALGVHTLRIVHVLTLEVAASGHTLVFTTVIAGVVWIILLFTMTPL